MKNTFAVTMTLLLALTLGGSVAGYRIATTPHHAEAAGAAGKTPEGGDPTTGKVVSEEAPSAREAATGAAGASGALGDVMQDQAGGTQSGPNGAVAVPGGESNTGTQTGAAQEGNPQDGGAEEAGEAVSGAQDTPAAAQGTTDTGKQTGSAVPSVTTENTEDKQGTQVGQTGSANVEKAAAGNEGISNQQAADIAAASVAAQSGEQPGTNSQQTNPANAKPGTPNQR